jgi:hypothetical protein
MQEENKSGLPEGGALPASNTSERAPTEKETLVERIEGDIKSDADKVIAAIEAWYEKHFHTAIEQGRAPISSDEKTALVTGVVAAVAPVTKE